MRDHTCQAQACIRTASRTCPKCFLWLCPDHLKEHDCEKLKTWATAGPSLNAAPDLLAPDVESFDGSWKEKWR